MVSGQKEEKKKKASGQIDEAVWTNTPSTNTGNSGLGERAGQGRGCILANKRLKSRGGGNSVYVNYGRSQTYTGRRLSIDWNGKGWAEKSDMPGGKEARDRSLALVLLSPITEMWKDIMRKPQHSLSCSSARLQTHTETHVARAHTHLCQCPTKIT